VVRQTINAVKKRPNSPTEEEVLNWLRTHFHQEEDPLACLYQTVGKSRKLTKLSTTMEDDEEGS